MMTSSRFWCFLWLKVRCEASSGPSWAGVSGVSVFVNLHQCGLVLASSVSHCLCCHVQLSHHSVSLFVFRLYLPSECVFSLLCHAPPPLSWFDLCLPSWAMFSSSSLMCISCFQIPQPAVDASPAWFACVFSCSAFFFFKSWCLKVTNTSLIWALTVDVLK